MFSSTPPTDASSFMLGPGPPIVTGDSERGPPGCNLFVFHLPNELTNWDLYLLFRKFGTIISVHTMINKNTGLSRGFGFVSLSKEDEAIAAVRSMDGFRLGKKRLKVQRKREHEEDDESFGPDFENLCGYSGFPSISTMVDQMTPPSSSSSTPRYSGSSAASPISQPPSAHRFNSQMLSSPTAALSNRGMSAASMSCPIARMSTIGSAQHREPFNRSQGSNNFASCEINQEASNLRVSFEKDCRLDIGDSSSGDQFSEPFAGILPRNTTGPPAQRLQQGIRGGFPGLSHYDSRANTSFGLVDGDDHYGSRSLLRDGGIVSGSRINVGVHTDIGRSAGLAGYSEDNIVGSSAPVVHREERVRDRRNSDDSFFYTRRLLDESVEGGTPSPGMSQPTTPRQFRQQFYQAAYQLQQQEDTQESPLVSEYELERRERSRSGSTLGNYSTSTEGKTSTELADRDMNGEMIGEILHKSREKALEDESFPEGHQYQPQKYVYDESEGQYTLR